MAKNKTIRKTGKTTRKQSSKNPVTTKKVAKSKHSTTALTRIKPEDILATLPLAELERMDDIAKYRAVVRALGAPIHCATCGFTGRYVQRQTIDVDPGSHYFSDKRRRTYLHLICMQCGQVGIYCPEAVGLTI